MFLDQIIPLILLNLEHFSLLFLKVRLKHINGTFLGKVTPMTNFNIIFSEVEEMKLHPLQIPACSKENISIALTEFVI